MQAFQTRLKILIFSVDRSWFTECRRTCTSVSEATHLTLVAWTGICIYHRATVARCFGHHGITGILLSSILLSSLKFKFISASM